MLQNRHMFEMFGRGDEFETMLRNALGMAGEHKLIALYDMCDDIVVAKCLETILRREASREWNATPPAGYYTPIREGVAAYRH